MRKQLSTFIASAVLVGVAPHIQAQTYDQTYGQPAPLSPKVQYEADRNDALARYKQDQQLCDDGLDAASRMQCKRDAKAEYDNAIAAARIQMAAAPQPAQMPPLAPPPPPYQSALAQPEPMYPVPIQPVMTQPAPAPSAPMQVACFDCGQVINVFQTEKKGQASGFGGIVGAVAGGILGHQVGGGMGKGLATIAGAAGGAFAGNAIEKNTKSSKVWVVAVSYPNGATSNFEFTNAPAFRVGDTVRMSGQTLAYP